MAPYPPQMPMPQPPRKSGMPGWGIALIVIGVVMLLGTCAVGAGIYAFATSKVGKTTIKLVGEGSKIAAEGLNAPGTAELRAAGCDQAMVVDMKKVSDLVNDLVDAGPDAAGVDGLLVTCQVTGRHAAPTCDSIAATYVRAVTRASGSFIVSVQRQGEHDPECQATYDPDGTPSAKGGI